MQLKSQKEREDDWGRKTFEEIVAEKKFKLDENYTLTDVRSITKFKWDKQKENHQSSSYSNS